MDHAGLSHPKWKLVLVPLAFLGALCLVRPAAGQSPVARVTTRSGVEFSVPATFRDIALPLGQPAQLERVLIDDEGSASLSLIASGFTADPVAFRAELPDVSGTLPARVARNFAAGVADGMRKTLHQPEAPYDFVPLAFDKERSAFSLRINLTLMSPARALLLEDDGSAYWAEVRKVGADAISLRCLLEEFQDGVPSHSTTLLEASDSIAADRCNVPATAVQNFHSAFSDPANFSPQVLVIRVAGFVTSTGLTAVQVIGPESRLADIDAAGSLIWTSAVVPAVAPPCDSCVAQLPAAGSAQADSLTWTERRLSHDVVVQLPTGWLDVAPATRDRFEATTNQAIDKMSDTAGGRVVRLLLVQDSTTKLGASFFATPVPGLTREALDFATDADLAESQPSYCEELRAEIGLQGFELIQCDAALREQGAGRSIVVTRYVAWARCAGPSVTWLVRYPGRDVGYSYSISVPQADEAAYRPVAERMWRGVTIKD